MQAKSYVACLTLAAAQKLKIAALCYLGLGKKKAQLDLMHSCVVDLSLCNISAMKHKGVQHLPWYTMIWPKQKSSMYSLKWSERK